MSSEVAPVTLATMPTFSSITTAISSRIAVWPDRCHSLTKLSVFSSRPNSAQSRVPARRNWMVVDAVDLKHEGVAQHLPDRGRLDVGALRRQPLAAALVPIVEQLAIGRVFHFAPPVSFLLRAGCVPDRDSVAVRLAWLRGTEQGAVPRRRVRRGRRGGSRVSVKSGALAGAIAQARSGSPT